MKTFSGYVVLMIERLVLVNRSGTPIGSHVVSSSNLLCFLVQQAWRFLRTPEQVQTCALFVTDSIISPCASWAPPCPGGCAGKAFGFSRTAPV